MSSLFTKDEIKWIKQYRTDNECGLQEAKRALLWIRIQRNLDAIDSGPLKNILEDLLELRRT